MRAKTTQAELDILRAIRQKVALNRPGETHEEEDHQSPSLDPATKDLMGGSGTKTLDDKEQKLQQFVKQISEIYDLL